MFQSSRMLVVAPGFSRKERDWLREGWAGRGGGSTRVGDEACSAATKVTVSGGQTVQSEAVNQRLPSLWSTAAPGSEHRAP